MKHRYSLTGETRTERGRLLHRLNAPGLWCFIRPAGSKPSRYYYVETKCSQCGKDIIAQRTNAKHHFCPYSSCFYDFQRGPNHPGWIGFTHSAGHKIVRINGRYFREHTLVAEKMLGRKLVKGELVHHIDCDKHNNDPSNLDVMTPSQHSAAHQSVNGILRGLIQAGVVWFDREKKIYRSKYGEVDIAQEAINRYQRNLRSQRRAAGNPIPRKEKAA